MVGCGVGDIILNSRAFLAHQKKAQRHEKHRFLEGHRFMKGRHLLLELYGCHESTLNDAAHIEGVIRAACSEVGLTLLVYSTHQFEPHGVTAVALLSESHLSIHTWPEEGYAAVDLYTCGESLVNEAAHRIALSLKATRVERAFIERGTGEPLRLG